MTPEDNKQDVPTPDVPPSIASVPAPEPPAFVNPETPPAVPVAGAPAAEPVTPPSDDKVWVSKEEYQRLQQTPTPVVTNGVAKVPKLFSGLQIAATAVAAVALIVGLVSIERGLSWIIVPAVIVLLLNGIFTLTDYLASKKPGYIVRTHKARNIILLVAACLVLASPVLFIGVILVVFLIICSTGGCNGT